MYYAINKMLKTFSNLLFINNMQSFPNHKKDIYLKVLD